MNSNKIIISSKLSRWRELSAYLQRNLKPRAGVVKLWPTGPIWPWPVLYGLGAKNAFSHFKTLFKKRKGRLPAVCKKPESLGSGLWKAAASPPAAAGEGGSGRPRRRGRAGAERRGGSAGSPAEGPSGQRAEQERQRVSKSSAQAGPGAGPWRRELAGRSLAGHFDGPGGVSPG